jgi:hypothetical protein
MHALPWMCLSEIMSTFSSKDSLALTPSYPISICRASFLAFSSNSSGLRCLGPLDDLSGPFQPVTSMLNPCTVSWALPSLVEENGLHSQFYLSLCAPIVGANST